MGSLISRGIAVLTVVGCVIWWPGLFDFADVPKALALQTGTLALVCAWLWWLWRQGGDVITCEFGGKRALLALLACLAWAGIAGLYALNRHEAAWVWLRWWPAAAIAGLIAATEAGWGGRLRQLQAVALAGGAVALIGAVQSTTGWSPCEQIQPPASTFANCNMAVDFVVLTLPVAAAWAVAAETTLAGSLLALAICGIGAFFVVATGCRAGWLALGLQTALWGAYAWHLGWEVVDHKAAGAKIERPVLTRRRLCRLALVVGLALAGALCLSSVRGHLRVRAAGAVAALAQLEGVQGIGMSADSITWRFKTYANTLCMIRDRPGLGVGLGNHKVQYPPYHRAAWEDQSFSEKLQLTHAHNDYLQWVAETGLIGLALAVALVILAFKAWRRMSAAIDPWKWGIVGAVALGFGVTAMFSFPLYRAAPPYVLGVLLGVVCAADELVGFKGVIRMPRWLVGTLLATAAALLLAQCWWSGRYLAADKAYRGVIVCDATSNWKGVVGCMRTVLRLDPGREKGRFYLGQALVELGQPKEGAGELRKCLEAYPHYINAWYNLGWAEYQSGRAWAAEAAYRRALEIKPGFFLALNNLGCLLVAQGRMDEAEQTLTAALAENPQEPLALANMGLVRAKQRRMAEAEALMTEALKRNPSLPLVKGWLEEVRKLKTKVPTPNAAPGGEG